MAVTINHTGFVVADLDRALAFYCDGLGLSLSFRVEVASDPLSQLLGYPDVAVKAAFVQGTDGHSLELIQYVRPAVEQRDPAEQYRRNVAGATHLSFIVDDLDATIARLQERGGRLLNPPAQVMDGLRSVYLQDPDGNWVELDEDAVHKAAPFIIHQRTAISPAPGQLAL